MNTPETILTIIGLGGAAVLYLFVKGSGPRFPR
jgi:hypothetical protein